MKTTTTKFLNSALTRIILGILLCFVIFILAQNLTGKALDLTSTNKDLRNLTKSIVASLSVLLVYATLFKKIERREISELSGTRLFKNIILGISIGAGLQFLTIAVIYLFGNFQITSINAITYVVTPFAIALSVAIFEEILLRGIIFRIAEEKLGSTLSLLLSAVIFGAVHLMNPGSSILSTLCTSLVGFIFGAAYIYSRSLWLPIAIHFSWNFVQSGIFGAFTSGNEKTNSLFNTTISGSDLITGGTFGPEGTLQAVMLWLVVSIILFTLIRKQNKLISPFWKKASRN